MAYATRRPIHFCRSAGVSLRAAELGAGAAVVDAAGSRERTVSDQIAAGPPVRLLTTAPHLDARRVSPGGIMKDDP